MRPAAGRAAEAVSLSAAIGYADAEFTRFDALQPGGVERIDRSGQPLPNAPELTATLGIRVDVPLGDGTLSTSINGTYRSKVLFSYLTDRPLDRWFRGELPWLDLLAEARTRQRPHLRPGGVAAAVDRHRSGRADLGHGLYLLVAAELHLRWLAGEVRPATESPPRRA
jgi:hypothetical protein